MIPSCARRNFELEGNDLVDAKWLPELNVMECQKLCGKIDGCHFFSSTTNPTRQCLLKLSSAAMTWKQGSISPKSRTYSGPAACGKLLMILFEHQQ